jgi:hypothetical protein
MTKIILNYILRHLKSRYSSRILSKVDADRLERIALNLT